MENDLKALLEIDEILDEKFLSINNYRKIGSIISSFSNECNSIRNMQETINNTTNKQNKLSSNSMMIDFDYYAAWSFLEEFDPAGIDFTEFCNALEAKRDELNNKLKFIIANHLLSFDNNLTVHIVVERMIELRLFYLHFIYETDPIVSCDLKNDIFQKLEAFSEINEGRFDKEIDILKGCLDLDNIEDLNDIRRIRFGTIEMLLDWVSYHSFMDYVNCIPVSFNLLLNMKIEIQQCLLSKMEPYDESDINEVNKFIYFTSDEVNHQMLKTLSTFHEMFNDEEYRRLILKEISNLSDYLDFILELVNDFIRKDIRKSLNANDIIAFNVLFIKLRKAYASNKEPKRRIENIFKCFFLGIKGPSVLFEIPRFRRMFEQHLAKFNTEMYDYAKIVLDINVVLKNNKTISVNNCKSLGRLIGRLSDSTGVLEPSFDFKYYENWVHLDSMPNELNLNLLKEAFKVAQEAGLSFINEGVILKLFALRIMYLYFSEVVALSINIFKETVSNILAILQNFLKSNEIKVYKVSDEFLADLKQFVKSMEEQKNVKQLEKNMIHLSLSLNHIGCAVFFSYHRSISEFMKLLFSLKVKMEEFVIHFHFTSEDRKYQDYQISILVSLSELCRQALGNEEFKKSSGNIDIELKSFSKLNALIEHDDYRDLILREVTRFYTTAYCIIINVDRIIIKEITSYEKDTQMLVSVIFKFNHEAKIPEGLKLDLDFITHVVRDFELQTEKENQNEHDLKLVNTAIDIINACLDNDINTRQACVTIGESLEKITWNESSQVCIRNKHGLYNKHKKANNAKNITGAKINFELLSRLKNLISRDPKCISFHEIVDENTNLIKIDLVLDTS